MARTSSAIVIMPCAECQQWDAVERLIGCPTCCRTFCASCFTAHPFERPTRTCDCGAQTIWLSGDTVERDDGQPYGWYDFEQCKGCGKEHTSVWMSYGERNEE